MLDKIVIDIETANSFAEVGGKQNLHLLKISLIGIYSYQMNQYFVFEEKEFPEFEKFLQKIGAFIGFALHRFDLPLLKANFPKEYFQEIITVDLLEEIEKVRGHKIKLDEIAQATLGKKKIGNGQQAIQLYKEGKIEELKSYCLKDVEITKDLYEFALENRYLYLPSFNGPLKIPLNLENLDEKLAQLSINKNRRQEQNLF